jgi:uncharacterized iron-regulated membrane protein
MIMKKTRKVHYWIGVIASLFLFIESVSGIYLYFQEEGRKNIQVNRQAFTQQQSPNSQNQHGGSNSTSSDTKSNGGNGTASFGGQNRQFNGGQLYLNRQGQAGINSFGMTLRQLHSGIIGLIAGIGLLIMTGTGLFMSIIIGQANRKRKKNAA